MIKKTKRQITAKINALDKARMKLGKEALILRERLQRENYKEEALRLSKCNYFKLSLGSGYKEILYMRIININEKNLMYSPVETIRITKDKVFYEDEMLLNLRGYEMAQQDEFIKAYDEVMNKIDKRLPLIRKTKVGLKSK